MSIESLIGYGLYAASAHNTQPWAVSLASDAFDLRPDRSRQLVADPSGREMFVSVGCFMGNVRVAARSLGLSVVESSLDDGVRIGIEAGSGRSSEDVLDAIRRRRNNRFPLTGPFDASPIRDIDRGDLEVHVVEDSDARGAVADIASEAFAIHLRDRGFREEFANWLRPNRSAAKDGIPGYALGFPTVLSYVMPFIVRVFSMSKMISGRENELMRSAPAIIAICGPDDQAAWMRAGVLFQEMAVRLEETGQTCAVNASPIEIESSADRLAGTVGAKGRPLVLFRCGLPTRPTRPTPRRPVDDFVR